MTRIVRMLAALVVAASTFAAASSVSLAQDAPMLLPLDAAPLVVEHGGKEIARFSLEVADDSSERSRGLMFRTEFPDDRGMLFVFEQTREVSFWMSNTPRSLDMVFVREDGTVSSIAEDTKPFSTKDVPSTEPVRYVLEINAGLAEELGIAPGDKLVHPLIAAGAQ